MQCFVRLGSCRLRPTSSSLHLDPDADLQLFPTALRLSGAAPAPLRVQEPRRPPGAARLRHRAGLFNAITKRKYSVRFDEDVAVVMLYSHTEVKFFADCGRLGHRFIEIQPGIQQSLSRPMPIYAVDLVRIGGNRQHPINLLSARRRSYSHGASTKELGPFAVLYDEIFLTEIKKMAQHNTPGNQQLLEDADRNVHSLSAGCARPTTTCRASSTVSARSSAWGLPPEAAARPSAPTISRASAICLQAESH